jgi:hypothetical protein
MTVTVRPVGLAQGLVRAALTAFKRPGPGAQLAPIHLGLDPVVIDPDHLARYARVCGFETGPAAPITYAQLLTFPLVTHFMTSTACPWPAMGTVHLANDITQFQAIRAGDSVRIGLQTGVCESHDKGQVFHLDLSVSRAETGQRLWQARQTLLRVGVHQPLGPAWIDDLAHHSEAVAPAWQSMGAFDAPTDIGRRYAAVSMDYNPIHLWPLTARLLGFRRHIAHGLWVQARALALWRPDGVTQPARLQASFKRPLFLPARATLWSAPGDAARSTGTTAADRPAMLFEARDAAGQVPHWRAQLTLFPQP